jgi:uncharacterized protein (TIGR02099 family)
MKSFGLKIYQISKWLLLIFLLLVALVNIGGRVLLANAELFRDQIEQQLADYGIRGVVLDNISAHWQGLQPVLNIEGGSLSIPGRSHALSVSALELRVKLVSSLIRGELVLESFYSHIEKLVLVRDKKGDWWLNDIPLTAHDSLTSALDIYVFFQRLPTFVDIDIGLIQLRDLRHGVDYLVQQGRLRSSRKQRDLSLELSANLPSTLGKKFHLILKGNSLQQKLYVEASQLNLRQLLQLTLVEKNYLRQAQLDFRGWAELDKFKILNIVSTADVSRLEFDSKSAGSASYGFSVLQTAQHNERGWNLSAQLKNVKKGTQSMGDYKVQLALDKNAHTPTLWLNAIDLPVATSLLAQLDPVQPYLQKLIASGAQGQVKDVTVQLDLENPAQSLLGLNFERVKIKRIDSLPGVNYIDGALLYAQGRAQLTMLSDNLQLDFGDFFRAPLQLGRVSASANARIDGDKILLQVPAVEIDLVDGKVQARMWMEKQGDGSPYLFIRSQYQNARVTAVSRYLPVKIMPPGVVKWLDKSLLGGDIEQGDFIYHGRLKKPSQLQKERAGLMHAAFTANNPRVDYLPDWPIISSGKGRVDFINAGLKLNFHGSRLAQSGIDKLDLEIADFHRAGIKINAQTKLPADVLLDTLGKLPLLKPAAIFQQQAQKISGLVESQVHIEIPLSERYPGKLQVNASARLENVSVSVPQWMIELEKINGDIKIKNENISAQNITGQFYGDKVNIDISFDQKTRRTVFDLAGEIHSPTLLKLAPDFLRKPVSGISAWQATVSLAHQPSVQNPLLRFSAQSALQGTALNFPQPLQKESAQKQLVVFNGELVPETAFYFKLDMTDLLLADGRINLQPGASQSLQYLNVGLQDKDELAPGIEGITVAGHAAELNIGDWFEYIKQYFPSSEENSDPFLKQLNSIDLKLDRLMIGKQQALQAHIKLYNNGKNLKGSIDSSLTQGLFALPYQMTGDDPLVAQLDFIKLKKTSSSQKFDPQIDDMPNLLIKSRIISYEKMQVNDFVLSTRNEGNIFVIEQLDFSRDQVQLKSSGHWEYQPSGNEHFSVFNIGVKGRNFGKAIKELGLGESIQGGKVDFNGQIGWGGSLFNINWPSLIGEVQLTLKDGYLKDVDPGAGRFVGLLSFSALPKRLFLDFGDVVKDGMQFDTIKGRFSIKGEIMTTDNASLDSVAAKVRIKGDTNLRRQTYNQTMIITPKIGDTLPLLGAITAGNAVGWGLLLLQKIFKKPIDKSVQIEYKVSGSWEDPNIELVAEKKLETDSNEKNFFYDGGQ